MPKRSGMIKKLMENQEFQFIVSEGILIIVMLSESHKCATIKSKYKRVYPIFYHMKDIGLYQFLYHHQTEHFIISFITDGISGVELRCSNKAGALGVSFSEQGSFLIKIALQIHDYVVQFNNIKVCATYEHFTENKISIKSHLDELLVMTN